MAPIHLKLYSMASLNKEWQVAKDLGLENSVPFCLNFCGLNTMKTEIGKPVVVFKNVTELWDGDETLIGCARVSEPPCERSDCSFDSKGLLLLYVSYRVNAAKIGRKTGSLHEQKVFNGKKGIIYKGIQGRNRHGNLTYNVINLSIKKFLVENQYL